MTNEDRKMIDKWISEAQKIETNPSRVYSRVKERIQTEMFNNEHFDNESNRERYDTMAVYIAEKAGV